MDRRAMITYSPIVVWYFKLWKRASIDPMSNATLLVTVAVDSDLHVGLEALERLLILRVRQRLGCC